MSSGCDFFPHRFILNLVFSSSKAPINSTANFALITGFCISIQSERCFKINFEPWRFNYKLLRDKRQFDSSWFGIQTLWVNYLCSGSIYYKSLRLKYTWLGCFCSIFWIFVQFSIRKFSKKSFLRNLDIFFLIWKG